MNKTHMEKRLNQLPTWLWTNSTTLPPIYKMVWEAVREDKVRSNGMQTELLVDTNKVFPLLLTSQLPTEVLGHIWNLANQKYAGQLTEQELYIVLALVAAAQASYTFNSLDVLHQLPFPPTPYLNIECLMNLQPVTQLNSATKYQSLNDNGEVNFIGSDGRYLSDIKGKGKLQPQGVISSDLNVQTTNIVPGKVSCFDNRSHGSSAAVWDLNNMFKDAKQSTRPQLDAKHLSVTDSCDDFTEFQSAPIPNIPSMPIWDTKQGSAIGSRLANHNLGVKKPIEKSKKNNINAKSVHGTIQTRIAPTSLNTPQTKDQQTVDCLPDIFPKCTIKNQSQTVILKDTVIRNNDPPRDYSENVKDHANMEVINITNDKDVISKLEWTEKASSGILEPTQQDLMNLQLVEDKYSALRALVQETTVSTEPDLNASCNNQSTDEFGDFVSAEQPATDTSVANTLDTENFSDIFTDFEFKTNNNNNTNTADFNLMPDISESFDNLKLEDTVEERSLDMGKAFQKEDAISINSIEFMNGASSNALTRSGSVPSLDLKSFLPSNAEDEQVADTTHQAEYWEWKQYMESCVLLLQIAANIFTNINSELVLHEVLNSAQGYNFLCNLAEVAAVCRRVNFSYKEMDINIIGFDELLMDIDRIWAEMEPFYANIPIVTELPAWPLHQGEAICCSLCLTVITSGRVVYNENNYHVTCANLWLNCVNSHLPVMRHPSFYTHTNVCPGNNHI